MSAATLSGPLDSCILAPGTYLIQTLPLEIEGHVVIPAGTRLIAPYEPNSNIVEVMPGGRLDMGRAAFYGPEEYPAVLPCVEIVPSDPNQLFTPNQIGIYIHRGADRRSRIENTIVKNCSIGIVVDEALENPIRGVITFGCYDGIHLYAPAMISDCQFWYNGSVFDWMSDMIWSHLDEYMNGTLFDMIYPDAGAGIYICLDGQAYPFPEVFIERTLVYDGDAGIVAESALIEPNVPEPNGIIYPLIPRINIINSCFVTSYFFGFYQSSNGVFADLSYCAFGDNWYDTNVSMPFAGCIGLAQNPFYNRPEDWEKIYVLPSSALVDAGCGTATDGTGTCPDWPDTGVVDIGCHFPLGLSGGFGIQSSPADLNSDGIVDGQDLALMNACMGATDDPNLVRMDFNYDSWINMPDYGILSWDFGYTADPNLPGHHDPNSARSDFNWDGGVDLEDLAILADNWLMPVFDEERFCRACNLHTGVEPNEPAAADGSHIIDERDRDFLMAEWGKGIVLNPSVSFYEPNGQPADPSQLFGVVSVQVEGSPVSTWVFAQIDGTLVGETYSDGSIPPVFEIPTYEFSNGSHGLTVGGYTAGGGCWMKGFPVAFANFIYFASIPDMYEPNVPYEITGFLDGGTVEISTEPNVSIIYDSGYIRHVSIISNPISSAATLRYQNGPAFQTQTFALTATVDMSKKDPNCWRAVIIAPCADVNRAVEDSILPNNRLLTAIRETLEATHIPYEQLIGRNANWDNIKIALTAPNLNYVYWIGHMSSQVGIGEDMAQRTGFMCWDKKGWWFDKKSCVFSWLNSDSAYTPVPIPDLPGDWNTRGHSMTSLGLWRTKTIKEFWAIGCESAVKWRTGNWNDMAMAVGVYAYKDIGGHYTHIYIGNRIKIMLGGARNLLEGYPSALSKIIRRHRTVNLENALLTNNLTPTELEVLWGTDRDRDGYSDNTLWWWPAETELWRVIFQ
ncbi:MAG TPA: hypothetical protein P5033_11990 [Anaerohalosphaeraceae bacterium]|nr:hypothetical protein [Anaerohalosphaeraceae bacterium]HRT24787.1 hypothetical protein [Anaerohalosphaeraceae bacterium]